MLVQLQYARAVAALLVVYFHTVIQFRHLDLSASTTAVLFGEVGVDLFFVLSGFVMWYTTANRNIQPLSFYRRRIERIVPLYWLFTLLAAGIALFLPQLLKSTVFDLEHLLASLFFIPNENPASPAGRVIAPVIVPGWTLNFEMYFYLIFGALLFLPQKFRIGALSLVLFSLFLIWQQFADQSVIAAFFGDAIVFEFLMGVLIGWLFVNNKRLPEGIAYLLIPSAFVCLIGFDVYKINLPHLVEAGIPAALLIYALVSIDFGKIHEFKFLNLLGDASYSLYITHVFVLPAVRVGTGILPFGFLRNEFVFMTLCMVASVVVALLVYKLFEEPVAKALKARR